MTPAHRLAQLALAMHEKTAAAQTAGPGAVDCQAEWGAIMATAQEVVGAELARSQMALCSCGEPRQAHGGTAGIDHEFCAIDPEVELGNVQVQLNEAEHQTRSAQEYGRTLEAQNEALRAELDAMAHSSGSMLAQAWAQRDALSAKLGRLKALIEGPPQYTANTGFESMDPPPVHDDTDSAYQPPAPPTKPGSWAPESFSKSYSVPQLHPVRLPQYGGRVQVAHNPTGNAPPIPAHLDSIPGDVASLNRDHLRELARRILAIALLGDPVTAYPSSARAERPQEGMVVPRVAWEALVELAATVR